MYEKMTDQELEYSLRFADACLMGAWTEEEYTQQSEIVQEIEAEIAKRKKESSK